MGGGEVAWGGRRTKGEIGPIPLVVLCASLASAYTAVLASVQVVVMVGWVLLTSFCPPECFEQVNTVSFQSNSSTSRGVKTISLPCSLHFPSIVLTLLKGSHNIYAPSCIPQKLLCLCKVPRLPILLWGCWTVSNIRLGGNAQLRP